jgi:AraC-like DNA-binding protein
MVRVRDREYPLRAGDAFHRYPDLPHDLEAHSALKTLYIALPEGSDSMLRACELPGYADVVLHPGLHDDLALRWRRMHHELGGVSPLRLAHSAVRMQELVVDLHLRALPQRHPAADRVDAACRLLERPQAPSLAAVARSVGMPPSTFRRVFVEVVGCPPWTWRLQRQMERARDLLLHNDRPIALIADALGFSDAATFSRRFTAVVGVSPRQWQKCNV